MVLPTYPFQADIHECAMQWACSRYMTYLDYFLSEGAPMTWRLEKILVISSITLRIAAARLNIPGFGGFDRRPRRGSAP